MKISVLSLVALLLLASPAGSTVVLTCRDLGGGVAELSYDASQEASLVRAFALDVTLSHGIIISTDNWSFDYWFYPSTTIIDPKTGEIVAPGTPVVPSDELGALGGLGTNGMTIAMASLYHENDPIHNTPPPVGGVLLTFNVSAGCDVIVIENSLRGGVVLEDITQADIFTPPCHIVPEPATVLLLGLGGLVLLKNRK